LAFAMLVAVLAVHIDKGLFVANNGYEFGLALLAVAVSLVVTGAGRASLDAALVARSTAR
jgi:putative oxidoreductase